MAWPFTPPEVLFTMTDPDDSTAAVRSHAMHLVTDLAIALTREAEHHNRQWSRQLSHIDELIELRVKGFEAEVQARMSELRGGLVSELDTEVRRSQRTGCQSAFVVPAAVICAAFLIYLAAGMSQEISRMTNYMESMRDDIGSIRLTMVRMDESTSAMARSVKAMTGNLTAMNERMASMNTSVALLHQETAMMRMSVGAMSDEARSMGRPLRFMSAFMPW
jgi:hypothetical protein